MSFQTVSVYLDYCGQAMYSHMGFCGIFALCCTPAYIQVVTSGTGDRLKIQRTILSRPSLKKNKKVFSRSTA